MTRAAIIALLLTGCQLLPEVPPAPTTDLADHELVEYQTEPVEPMPRVSLPQPYEGPQGEPRWTLGYEHMQSIGQALAVGDANTKALEERNRQIEAINFERQALLRAGQFAESQSRFYHQLYANERQQGWLDSLVCRGVTGGALLFLAAGAL